MDVHEVVIHRSAFDVRDYAACARRRRLGMHVPGAQERDPVSHPSAVIKVEGRLDPRVADYVSVRGPVNAPSGEELQPGLILAGVQQPRLPSNNCRDLGDAADCHFCPA